MRYQIFGQQNGLVIGWLLLFCVSLVLGLASLDSIPNNLNPDEADTLQTYLFLKNNWSSHLFGFNWNGAPAVSMLVTGAYWDVLGQASGGIRVISVLLSALGVSTLFVILARVVNMKLAWGVTLLMTTSPWFLNFSRSGWENIWNILPILWATWGLFLLFEKRQVKVAWLLLLVSSVVGFYSYHPGKLIGLSVLAILVGYSWLGKKIRFLHICWLAGMILILIYPQLFTTFNLTEGHNTGLHRIQNVSMFRAENADASRWNKLFTNLQGFLLFDPLFFDRYKINHRYVPMGQNPIGTTWVLFYWLGLIVAWKRYRYWLFFYVMMLFPVQVLSAYTPNAARAIHILPLIYLFIGLGAQWFVDWFGLKKNWLLVVLLGGFAVYQTHYYFGWINEPEIVYARRPVVKNEDYDFWLMEIRHNASYGPYHLPVSAWQEIRRGGDGVYFCLFDG